MIGVSGTSALSLTCLCFIERVRILSSWLRSNIKLRPTSSWWGLTNYTKKLEEEIFEFRPAVAVSWMFMRVKAHVAFLGGSTRCHKWTPFSLIGLREQVSYWRYSAEGFTRKTAITKTVYHCSVFYTHFFLSFYHVHYVKKMSIFILWLFLFFPFLLFDTSNCDLRIQRSSLNMSSWWSCVSRLTIKKKTFNDSWFSSFTAFCQPASDRKCTEPYYMCLHSQRDSSIHITFKILFIFTNCFIVKQIDIQISQHDKKDLQLFKICLSFVMHIYRRCILVIVIFLPLERFGDWYSFSEDDRSNLY